MCLKLFTFILYACVSDLMSNVHKHIVDVIKQHKNYYNTIVIPTVGKGSVKFTLSWKTWEIIQWFLIKSSLT